MAQGNAFITKNYTHWRVGPEIPNKHFSFIVHTPDGGKEYNNLIPQGCIPIHLQHKFVPNCISIAYLGDVK